MKKITFEEFLMNRKTIVPYIYRGNSLKKLPELSPVDREWYTTITFNDEEYYDPNQYDNDGWYDDPANEGHVWWEMPFYFDKGMVVIIDEKDKEDYIIDWCNVYDKP